MQTMYLDTSYGRIVTLEQRVLEERYGKLRRIMAQRGLSMLFVAAPDIGGYRPYLTGSCNLDRFSTGGILLGLKGMAYLVRGDGTFDGNECKNDNQYRAAIQEIPYRYIETNGFDAHTLRQILNGNHAIGIIHKRALRSSLRDYFVSLGVERLEDLTFPADEAKMEKSLEELEALCAQANSLERALRGMEAAIVPGITDWEVANSFRHCQYRLGGYGNDNGISSDIRVQVNADGYGTYNGGMRYPGKYLQRGDRLNVSAICVGTDSCYGSISRCYVVGKEPDFRLEALWNVAVDAQKAAVKALNVGSTLRKAAQCANQRIEAHGCVNANPNWFIHGIGWGMRERPFLTDESKDWPLKKGCTLVVAPEILSPDGERICCGDVFVVREDRAVQIGSEPQMLRAIG